MKGSFKVKESKADLILLGILGEREVKGKLKSWPGERQGVLEQRKKNIRLVIVGHH